MCFARAIAAGALFGLSCGAAAAADEITNPDALRGMAALINGSGYSCDHVIGAWKFGVDEFGEQTRVVCPGSGLKGSRFRVWFNPTTKLFLVRDGW